MSTLSPDRRAQLRRTAGIIGRILITLGITANVVFLLPGTYFAIVLGTRQEE